MKFSVFALAGVAVAVEHQVMVLMDATRSGPIVTKLPTMLSEALEAIHANDPSYSFAVSHFTDKPAPYTGVGAFGDYPGPYTEDYCYKNQLAFTTDTSKLDLALHSIREGSGLDPWEAQFEAMVRAAIDTEVGWSESAQKIVLLVTDSFGHTSAVDTLEEKILGFNEPSRCSGGQTKGGFTAQSTSFDIGGWVNNQAGYKEFADLHYKRQCVADLTADEQTRYDELREVFKVRTYPAVRAYDLETMKSNPDEHCRYYEYPFYSDVTEVYNAKGIKFMVLYHDAAQIVAASYSDEVVWTWALSDSWALADTPNVWEHIADLDKITATSKTESDTDSLEKILLSGFNTLTKV